MDRQTELFYIEIQYSRYKNIISVKTKRVSQVELQESILREIYELNSPRLTPLSKSCWVPKPPSRISHMKIRKFELQRSWRTSDSNLIVQVNEK